MEERRPEEEGPPGWVQRPRYGRLTSLPLRLSFLFRRPPGELVSTSPDISQAHISAVPLGREGVWRSTLCSAVGLGLRLHSRPAAQSPASVWRQAGLVWAHPLIYWFLIPGTI